MLKRLVLVAGLFAVSFSAALWAQPQPPTATEAASSETAAAERKIHLEGCVFPRQALMTSGQTAAQPGAYVLTDAKLISVSPGVNDSVDRIFTLEQVPEERLNRLSGKRADVSARIAGTDEAPRLQVIAIVEAVGLCRLPGA